jgi:hypothetical protein
MMSPDVFVNFSDCDADISLSASLLAFLARHYGLDDLMRLANMQYTGGPSHNNSALSWSLRDLVWRPDPAFNQRAIPTKHDWYPDMQWMIARYDPQDPDAFVLAAKGGHNNEMHNQNDVGNIIVHFNRTSVIADIGRGRYTRQYFTDSLRYDFLVNSSLGHSLPVPNGCTQLPGEEYAAHLLDHQADDTRDRLSLELKDAYPPEVDLESLKRTVTLHREALHGWIELVDDVTFGSPGTFESVLTTFGNVDVGPDSVRIKDGEAVLNVQYDPAVVEARVEIVEDVDLATGARDVTRVIFALPSPEKSASIRLVIVSAVA